MRIKGIVHPKMKNLSFTHSCPSDILKNVGNQTVDGTHWLQYRTKKILY